MIPTQQQEQPDPTQIEYGLGCKVEHRLCAFRGSVVQIVHDINGTRYCVLAQELRDGRLVTQWIEAGQLVPL